MGIGVIGLGNIGGAIAANLVADGHDVIVYDTDPTRVTAIAGANAATTVGRVAGAADITLLSLPTPAIVDEVAKTWAEAAAAGSILVDLATNSVTAMRALGDRLATSGH